MPGLENKPNSAWAVAGLGMEMAAAVGVGAYVGHRLDQHFELGDVLGIVLPLAGFCVTVYHTLILINRRNKESKK